MNLDYTEIMVRYGELSTKGKNRRSFIMRLAENVKGALAAFPAVTVKGDRDRMHLYLNGTDSKPVMERLTKVFGIQNFSPSIRVEKDLDVIIATVQALMQKIYTGSETLKITAKRCDH